MVSEAVGDDAELLRYQEKKNTSEEYLTVAKLAMKEARFRDASVVLTDAIDTCRARSIQVSLDPPCDPVLTSLPSSTQAEAYFQRAVCNLQVCRGPYMP